MPKVHGRSTIFASQSSSLQVTYQVVNPCKCLHDSAGVNISVLDYQAASTLTHLHE